MNSRVQKMSSAVSEGSEKVRDLTGNAVERFRGLRDDLRDRIEESPTLVRARRMLREHQTASIVLGSLAIGALAYLVYRQMSESED